MRWAKASRILSRVPLPKRRGTSTRSARPQLDLDVGHLADHGDGRGIGQRADGRGGDTHQSQVGIGDLSGDGRADLLDEEAGGVGVGWVAQGPVEEDGRGRADLHPAPWLGPPIGSRWAPRRPGPRPAARARSASRALHTTTMAVPRSGAPVQPPPPPHLLGRERACRPTVEEASCRPRAGNGEGQTGRNLVVLEIVQVEHGRRRLGPADQRPRTDTEIPDQVVGARA